ncbi:MAG: SulP family inorganic anion transporter [Candidatus Xenobia bacterium]
MTVSEGSGYRWFVAGDINGFFGLMIDNMTVLSYLAFFLTVVFGFPADIVLYRMFPGTALGVMFGDLVYTWMAFRLAKRTGKTEVTAMPLGLDTPSTIGIALTVLGPAFLHYKAQGLSPNDAALATWYLGMATMVYIGVLKLALSFVGPWIQRIVPQAGLLGSLAGIGLALIGFLPLVDIFRMPVVGALSLGIILYTLVAGIRLPGRLPGVAVAIILSTVLYYLLPVDWVGGGLRDFPHAALHFAFPMPTLNFVRGLHDALQYLPIAIPFGLLTVVGGINVTESARVGGDDYSTREILLTEAIATLVAGLCGGVAQSTPYIGQPAYKAMGSRAGFTVLTGIFIGLGGMLGYVPCIVEAIPKAVLAPVLIFVALDIVSQSYVALAKRYAPAVSIAFLPTVARMVWIEYGGLAQKFHADITQFFAAGKATAELPEVPVTNALGNGFIVTAMLWGGFLAHLIDRKLKPAALYVLILAVLTFFGIIHSVTPDGNMYFPWNLPQNLQVIAYQFTAAYLVLAAVFFALSFTAESKEPPEDHIHGMVAELDE